MCVYIYIYICGLLFLFFYLFDLSAVENRNVCCACGWLDNSCEGGVRGPQTQTDETAVREMCWTDLELLAPRHRAPNVSVSVTVAVAASAAATAAAATMLFIWMFFAFFLIVSFRLRPAMPPCALAFCLRRRFCLNIFIHWTLLAHTRTNTSTHLFYTLAGRTRRAEGWAGEKWGRLTHKNKFFIELRATCLLFRWFASASALASVFCFQWLFLFLFQFQFQLLFVVADCGCGGGGNCCCVVVTLLFI